MVRSETTVGPKTRTRMGRRGALVAGVESRKDLTLSQTLSSETDESMKELTSENRSVYWRKLRWKEEYLGK